MFLACDLGNTFAKFAIYNGNDLIRFLKCSYDQFSADLFSEYEITHSSISSVVPVATGKVSSALSEKFGITPYIIHSGSAFNVKINYLTPQTLGIDRICSMEGAFSLFRSDPAFSGYNAKTFLLTVDLGTATTINIVQYYAEFIGGIIMPGLATMARSLTLNTAKLPEIDLSADYRGFWGNDTPSSIASGIINSTISLIEKTMIKLKSEFNAEIIMLYVTGGNSGIMEKHLKDLNAIYIKDLVLRGAKAVFERNFID